MVSGKLRNDSESEETNRDKTMESSANRRTCVNCSTTRTPLWRGGPAGPRSLCNACGIRHRKSKRAPTCMDRRSKDQKKRRRKSRSGGEKGLSLKIRLKGVCGEMRVLREEEEAAILLMALSYGYGSAKTFIDSLQYSTSDLHLI